MSQSSKNPFDDLLNEEDDQLWVKSSNPFDSLDELPPLPKQQVPRSSPLLKPFNTGGSTLPLPESKESLGKDSLGGTREFAVIGMQGSPFKPNPRARTDSKDSGAAFMSESELEDETDPNHRALPYVLNLLNEVNDNPEAILYQSYEQYLEQIQKPLGKTVKYLFVYHTATKVYQLQNPSTGGILLIGKKRTDGLKMLSSAFNFSIGFPSMSSFSKRKKLLFLTFNTLGK